MDPEEKARRCGGVGRWQGMDPGEKARRWGCVGEVAGHGSGGEGPQVGGGGGGGSRGRRPSGVCLGGEVQGAGQVKTPVGGAAKQCAHHIMSHAPCSPPLPSGRCALTMLAMKLQNPAKGSRASKGAEDPHSSNDIARGWLLKLLFRGIDAEAVGVQVGGAVGVQVGPVGSTANIHQSSLCVWWVGGAGLSTFISHPCVYVCVCRWGGRHVTLCCHRCFRCVW